MSSSEASLPTKIRRIRALIKKSKMNSDLWIELSHLTAQSGDRIEAVNAAEKALKYCRNNPGMTLHACEVLQQLDEPDLACFYYQKCLSAKSDRPVIASLYAELCERRNRPEEGLPALDNLSPASQELASPLLARIKLTRRIGDLDQAWHYMERLIAKDESIHLPENTRISLWHEAFRLLDKRKQYSAAYDALLKSKKINRSTISDQFFELKKATKRDSYKKMLRILDELTPELLSSWRSSETPEKQPAFLLGHPRSGTTLLENILESHSGIISSDERSFFQTSVIDPITRPFQPTRSEANAPREFLEYLSNLPKIELTKARNSYYQGLRNTLGIQSQKKIFLDKNPAITDGALIIKRIFPNSKIIFAIRDPRAVAWSAFTLPLHGTSWIGTFWFDLKDTAEAYSFLIESWKRLRSKLPEHDFIEVKYEDTVENLQTQGEKVVNFLGLNWEEQQEKFYQNAKEKLVRSPTYADVSKPVYTSALDHWRNYEEILQPVTPSLEPYIEEYGYSL